MRRVLVLALLAACGSRDESSPPPEPPQRRVIEPPPDDVRERPPHAIRVDGVGPYKLGIPLDSVRLASGVPRNSEYDIPGVVHASVTRTDDTILLGGTEPRGLIQFVAVVGSDVARTETGSVHVGSTVEELDKALGPRQTDVEIGRDPHLIVPSKLPTLRAVVSGDAISALVVRADVDPARTPGPAVDAIAGSPECPRPAPVGTAFGACLNTGELVSIEGDDVQVRMPDSEKPIANARVTGLVFAAPVRAGDRDDLIVVARSDDGSKRTWSLVAFRMESGKLVRTQDNEPLYQLTPTSTRWIGAELRDVELYLEVTGRPDTYEVGGVLVTRPPRVRDALVLTPISLARKRGKPVFTDASDAGVPAH